MHLLHFILGTQRPFTSEHGHELTDGEGWPITTACVNNVNYIESNIFQSVTTGGLAKWFFDQFIAHQIGITSVCSGVGPLNLDV